MRVRKKIESTEGIGPIAYDTISVKKVSAKEGPVKEKDEVHGIEEDALSRDTITVTVKERDTLRKIALMRYGRADSEVIGLIQKANPKIKDINYIIIGQEIVLPELNPG